MFITERVYDLIVQREWHKTNKWKDICGIHLKRELKGDVCACLKKNLAMKCDRKKNPTCL